MPRKGSGPYHPLDKLPALPEQCAFMRLEMAFCYLRPFMNDAEGLAIRQRIYQWDVSHAVQPERKKRA
jgi:hypothetical protein